MPVSRNARSPPPLSPSACAPARQRSPRNGGGLCLEFDASRSCGRPRESWLPMRCRACQEEIKSVERALAELVVERALAEAQGVSCRICPQWRPQRDSRRNGVRGAEEGGGRERKCAHRIAIAVRRDGGRTYGLHATVPASVDCVKTAAAIQRTEPGCMPWSGVRTGKPKRAAASCISHWSWHARDHAIQNPTWRGVGRLLVTRWTDALRTY